MKAPSTNEQPHTGASVGFIGLGAMGMGMAGRLISSGASVVGHDVRPEARDAFSALGGRWAATPHDAAKGATILALMVVNSDQIEACLFGEGGALEALAKGSVVVVHSTVPAAYARNLGLRLGRLGLLMLDAPVSGGVGAARKGTLSVMAAGSEDAFRAAAPLLSAVSAKLFKVGDEPGMGSVVKTVNQLLAGSHIALAAEAMAMGTKAGVDPRVLYEVISNSAGNSWMFTNRVPHMLDGDFTPLSAVNIFVKDLGIVLDSAREMKFPVPMAALAHQIFMMAAASGHGAEDDAAVVKVYEAMGGTAVAAPRPDAGG